MSLRVAFVLLLALVSARAQLRQEIQGPFAIGEQGFTVVLEIEGDPGAAEDEQSVRRLQIRDDRGAVHHAATFSTDKLGEGFHTVSVQATLVQGRARSGLILTFFESPSTPRGGAAVQFFAVFEGKLKPMSAPIAIYGEMMGLKPGAAPGSLRLEYDPERQADIVRLQQWTGNFDIIFPLHVDLLRARVEPAWRCYRLAGGTPQPVCKFAVAAAPRARDSVTFVRLFDEADAGLVPAHVVVRPDSQVEILQAQAEWSWFDDPREGAGVRFGEDPWLEVRIDGRRGWIHTQEDFLAIGLPEAD